MSPLKKIIYMYIYIYRTINRISISLTNPYRPGSIKTQNKTSSLNLLEPWILSFMRLTHFFHELLQERARGNKNTRKSSSSRTSQPSSIFYHQKMQFRRQTWKRKTWKQTDHDTSGREDEKKRRRTAGGKTSTVTLGKINRLSLFTTDKLHFHDFNIVFSRGNFTRAETRNHKQDAASPALNKQRRKRLRTTSGHGTGTHGMCSDCRQFHWRCSPFLFFSILCLSCASVCTLMPHDTAWMYI